jgi:hypothetical protein
LLRLLDTHTNLSALFYRLSSIWRNLSIEPAASKLELETTGRLILERQPVREPTNPTFPHLSPVSSHRILEPQATTAWRDVGQINNRDAREMTIRTSL